MKKLSFDECKALAYGGTLYGTGGGLPCETQMKIFSDLFAKNVSLTLCSIDELQSDALLCCVHGIGPAGSFSQDFSRAVSCGIQTLEERLGRSFQAVFPVETSIESAVLTALSMTSLPLVDADVTGGRAVPEISMDNFFIAGHSVAPAVLINLDLQSIFIKESISPQELEKASRDFANNSRENLIALIDHPIEVKEATHLLSLGVVGRTMRAGEVLLNNMSIKRKLEELKKCFSMNNVDECIVRTVCLSRKDGFLQGEIILDSIKRRGVEARIKVKNENMKITSSNYEYSFPELITLFNLETGVGVHNAAITEGMRVSVLISPAELLWREAWRDRF